MVDSKKRRAAASTPESRENQLIALAVDLVEEQLMNGTASAQVISHYLKLGSTRERLEKEKIRQENELLKAKTQALTESKTLEKLYQEALGAMRSYSGQDGGSSDED